MDAENGGRRVERMGESRIATVRDSDPVEIQDGHYLDRGSLHGEWCNATCVRIGFIDRTRESTVVCTE